MAKKAKDKEPRRAIQLGATALTFTDSVAAVPIAKGFSMSVNGLEVDEAKPPSLAACEKLGVTLRVVERGAQFALGDFINYVEARFGEEAAQIIDASSGWSEKTVSVYRWISARVNPAIRRMDRLGIRHHLLVAGLTPAQQEKWLTKASNDDGDEPWTVSKLGEAMTEVGDAPDTAWWVLVATQSAADQASLMASLEAQGRQVKALQKHDKKKN